MKTDELVEAVARAICARTGLNWDEWCGLEIDPDDECQSSTCVAAYDEDHDPDVMRAHYRGLAQAAIVAARPAIVEAALAPLDDIGLEIEDVLKSEGIYVWGPDGERFERMFNVWRENRLTAIRAMRGEG